MNQTSTDQQSRFVFVSFASPQKKIAERIKLSLKRKSVSSFYSNSDIEWGEHASPEIESLLEDDNCVFMPIYSEDYFDTARMSFAEFHVFFNKHRFGTPDNCLPICLDDYEVKGWKRVPNYISLKSDSDDKTLLDIASKVARKLKSKLPSPSVKTRRTTEDQYLSFLIDEWNIIDGRLKERMSASSRSQVNCFGWLAANGLKEPILDPKISSYHIRFQLNRLYSEPDLNRNRININASKGSHVRGICSVRFLFFCHLIAAACSNSVHDLYGEFMNGLNKQCRTDIHTVLSSILRLSDEMIKGVSTARSREIAIEMFGKLGSVAQLEAITIDDLLLEECLPKRSIESTIKAKEVLDHNRITHKIEIHVLDIEGIYSALMKFLSKNCPHFNVITSYSETLVPDRIAQIKLSICCDYENLDEHVQRIVREDDRFRVEIFSLQVQSM